MRNNIKTALASLRSSRWRSLLTMFGIIVGVVAVVVTISLGLGVKKQLADQINQLGKDVVAVRPASDGSLDSLSGGGVFAGLTASPLTDADIKVVSQSRGVEAAVPMAVGSGFASVGSHRLLGGSIIATSSDLPRVLHQPIRFGVFFSQEQSGSDVVVIGQAVAEELFQESAPIGRTLTIRGQDFIVSGVFDQFAGSSLALGTDLNKAVFIPYDTAASLTNGNKPPVAEVFALLQPGASLSGTTQAIRKNLLAEHSGQEDFKVLARDQALQASSTYVTLFTQVFTAVAALSLLVGGIGIANIMLVSVTERTREIGIRKAVGATNRQILSQFLAEAATLSFVGGVIGVALSLATIFMIRIFTNLHPVMNAPVMLAALLIAWLVGVIFGVAPAAKAARKNPIDALRHE